ncbi:MAG TPA: LPS assembly lipoprotein LptE [Kiritimatiellia bacterium]|nr:LPS assembly lipoprotein LptE [Kiritimatiellia bacterium]
MKPSNNSTRPACLPLAAALALLLLGAGCAGYRVGSMLPGDIKTVHVPTFINQTSEPLIEVDATQATLRRIQQDGSLTVATESEADAILTVVLTEYRLEPVVFRKDRRSAAQEYRLNLVANMVLRRTSDQSVVVESPRVIGDHVFEVFGDLSSSKLRANPNASEDLARRIVERLVEYW